MHEEVGAAINHLKRGSSAGPDSLSHAGPLIIISMIRSWLCKIFNAIVNLKAIPSPFKTGVIIPIYKEKGRDSLLPTSYRGITLTSVIAKTFEYSILDRMLPILRDATYLSSPRPPTSMVYPVLTQHFHARRPSPSLFVLSLFLFL